MRVTLQPVTVTTKILLANLMQFYLHDLSEAEAHDVGKNGLFKYPNLDNYWKLPDHAATLIYVDGQIAGFALVHTRSRMQAWFEGHVVAAFFVLRRYRRQGIGRVAAIHLFDAFPGVWEIASATTNVPAHCFWRSVIQAYTDGHYHESWLKQDDWYGYIHSFETKKVSNC